MTQKQTDKKGSSIFTGMLCGALYGAACGAAMLLLLPFAVLRFDDPQLAISISAILTGAASGFVSGKITRSKSPDTKPFVCGLGGAVVLAFALILLSFSIKPQNYEPWVTYTAFGMMFLFSLIGASGSTKSKKRPPRR